MANKIIIDTDPGIDDALAIACAVADSKADIIGICSVHGNACIEQTTENVLRILDILEVDIPVYKGAERPLVSSAKNIPSEVHGINGLGDIPQPRAKGKPQATSAAQFIVDMAHKSPGEITIVTLGPLTNLALALSIDRSIESKIERVVVMGGALNIPGNISAAAEANLYSDPHAADQVCSAKWPLTMVGLDVTHQIKFSFDYYEKMAKRNVKIGLFLHDITRFYLNFYKGFYHMDECYVHDPFAIAFALNPHWFETESGQLRVVCEGEWRGKLMMYKGASWEHIHNPWLNRPYLKVTTGVAIEKIKDWMMTVL